MSASHTFFSRHRTGFTLVELMIAMVIGLVLIGGVIVVFLSAQQAIAQAQAMSRVQENLRFASDFLVRDIRNAGFRDEASLAFGDWLDLATSFVEIEENGRGLTVRYAGRGDCNQAFRGAHQEVITVENRYTVNDGELQCNGVLLVSGIRGMNVSPLCPSGGAGCTCPTECLGVMMTLELDGGGAGAVDRTVPLKATFRNRVLESIFPD